jgi:hypothetical protein
MSSEAVPIGHHDEHSVTLGESSASTASRRRDHALYLIWRQVFTAAAGVVWLADGRLLLALCQNGDWQVESLRPFALLHIALSRGTLPKTVIVGKAKCTW